MFMLSHGQTSDKIPLTEALEHVEAHYDVRFSYADKNVKDVLVSPINTQLSLKEVIVILEKETGLRFNQLNNRFISVEEVNTKASGGQFIIQKLDEVIVENYLTKGISKSVDGAINITPQKFGILPGLIEPDVLHTIQALPGVISADERISNINVRGGTNDQNLILFEGMKMYQSGHFFGLISAFNPYLSEEVNVSKNGTKVKYGDGVSSIISIANSDELTGKVKGGAGTNLISIDGFIVAPLSEKTELQLAARRSYTDLFSSPTYDAYFERIFRDSEFNINERSSDAIASEDERFYFYDVNAKFLYDISPSSKLRVNFINIFNTLDYSQEFFDTNNNLQNRNSQLDQKSYAANITYTKEWKNNLIAKAQIYYSDYEIDANSNNLAVDQNLNQINEVQDIGIRLDVVKPLDKFLNLNTGYQFNEVGVTNEEIVTNPTFRSLSKQIIRTHAVYGEAEFTSSSKSTYARIGFRVNYLEKFGEVLNEPRIAVSQKLSDNLRLEFLGEFKSQSITQIADLQQDFFGIEKRRWQLSDNESIPIQKSQQASIGINYNDNGWLVNVEAYTKKIDGITTRSQAFQNQFQFVEDIGEYNVNGFDVLINKQFQRFSSWLSYSYGNNNYTFETINNGEAFPNNIDITHAITFASTYVLDDLKIGFGINWHSGRPYTTPAEAQNPFNDVIEYNTPNNERLIDYMRADISAVYKFNLSSTIKAEAGASIWNILNQDNIINRFYTLDLNNEIIQVNNRALGFTPNFSFRIIF